MPGTQCIVKHARAQQTWYTPRPRTTACCSPIALPHYCVQVCALRRAGGDHNADEASAGCAMDADVHQAVVHVRPTAITHTCWPGCILCIPSSRCRWHASNAPCSKASPAAPHGKRLACAAIIGPQMIAMSQWVLRTFTSTTHSRLDQRICPYMSMRADACCTPSNTEYVTKSNHHRVCARGLEIHSLKSDEAL